MGIEIERKFLVTGRGWRQPGAEGNRIRQGYLSTGNGVSVRVRLSSTDGGTLTIKSANPGRKRSEFEYPIPLADAEALLKLAGRRVISKTRYHVEHAGLTWHVDVFHGDNAGLIMAEIELTTPRQSFPHPGWIGEEVTDDRRYYNASLAIRPWKS